MTSRVVFTVTCSFVLIIIIIVIIIISSIIIIIIIIISKMACTTSLQLNVKLNVIAGSEPLAEASFSGNLVLNFIMRMEVGSLTRCLTFDHVKPVYYQS